MGEKLFSPIETVLYRAEDRIEEWRGRYQARNAEAEADRDKLWAEAKEREKLLAKAIGEEEAGRATVVEGTERHRFVFVVHSEEAYKELASLAGERYRLVRRYQARDAPAQASRARGSSSRPPGESSCRRPRSPGSSAGASVRRRRCACKRTGVTEEGV